MEVTTSSVLQQFEQWQQQGADPDEAEDLIAALQLTRLDGRQLWAVSRLLGRLLKHAQQKGAR